MKVIVMRHGKANAFAKHDSARSLTDEGILQAKNQGLYLKQHQITPQRILVSPYIRTQETLEYLLQTANFQLTPQIEITEDLTPYGDPHILTNYLHALATQGIDSILIISHLPLVEEITTSLGINKYIGFSTATMAILEWNGDLCSTAQLIGIKHTN